MPAVPLVAIGRIGARGQWVGFVRDAAGFHLAVAQPGEATAVSPARGANRIAELLAWMATETDTGRNQLVREALDAIDDGLAGDAVVARLSEARRGLPEKAIEQADAIDLLAQRVKDLRGRSAAGEAAPSV